MTRLAKSLMLASLLVLGGLGLLAFAELPPGLPGLPYHHLPVQARVAERSVTPHGDSDATAVSRLRLRYDVAGQAYEGSYAASNGIVLPSGHRFGDLRPGDVLEIWIAPERPAASPALRPDRRLGNDAGQILLGGALVIAGVLGVIGAFFQARR